MEPAVEAPAAADGSGLLRIFVGGLSTSVTAADMEKTFSPMGRIAGVDFVRTNGRSFAYMDFEPASDRALAKLFSTYNGCIWKGGKLKLEKAKEHYLTRLKKEWEEDANANLVPTTPANPIPEKITGPPKKLDLLKQENMQLKIFFPNLRKVKSVPFKGTGKHKYSFQRIEVPPLPIHFCDCEEHCGPYEMSREKYQSSFDKVINEKELDVMNSVMNKLFAKEGSKTAIEETVNLGTDANNIPSEEDQVTDEDNIVTNIGIGGSNDILMHLRGRQTQLSHQETSYGKLQPSKDRFTKNKANSDRRKNTVPATASEVADDKKSYPVSIVKPTEDEFTPILSRKVRFQEPEIVEEAPPVKIETEIKVEAFESRKGNSWLQKSSWKDLVGEKNNNSFSISHLLPETNSTAPETVTTSDPEISMSSAAKKRKVKISVEEPRSTPVPVSIVKPTEDEFTPVLSRKVRFQEPEIVEEAPPVKIETEIKVEAFESRKGNSWQQKSSWKDLVGEKNNNSFSISHLLPETNSTAPETVTTSDPDISISSVSKKRKVKISVEEPRSMPVPQNIVLGKATGLNNVDYTDVEPRMTASKKRKADSRKDERGSQAVSPILMLEETMRLNHIEISKEGDGIEANLKGAKEAEACTDAAEHKMTEDEPITVSPEVVADNNSVPCKDAVSSKQGSCWLQKSSWKDLLGDSSFSISSILPTGNSALTISTAATDATAESDEDKSNSTLSTLITPKEKVVGSHQKSEMKEETLESSEECQLAGGNGDVVVKRTKSKLVSRKGSSFMRSEESLREWRTVKQALSGFISNKNVEKNTSKGSKGMPSRKL